VAARAGNMSSKKKPQKRNKGKSKRKDESRSADSAVNGAGQVVCAMYCGTLC